MPKIKVSLQIFSRSLCNCCRSKKKLNYADLCDDSEDEEPGTFTEARSQERAPQPDQLDRMQSPRERKRPKSAPNSVMQQPLPTPSAERQAKLKQALLLQMEMQRRLHDQLEVLLDFRLLRPVLHKCQYPGKLQDLAMENWRLLEFDDQ